MTALGQLLLLVALVAAGYAAFACMAAAPARRPALGRRGSLAAAVSVAALSAATGLLAWALIVKDFRFASVAQYTSSGLPWHYRLSALWVGQAGSLLLWAWMLGILAMAYRFWPRRRPSELRGPTFGLLMACVCFLVAVMVFAADPMQPSLAASREGAGLSPLLQHPVMLLHPPVVFLGYAAWAIPFALAVAAMGQGRLDAAWVREARPWALFAWAVLGAGILLGAEWAYEELGWGGYWSWDPVENGSLIPWLTGTALIHALLAWQHCGALKKTSLALAVATFGLCSFAAFLTRSGIFSSLHAFSQSPVGWMFLVLTAALAAGGAALLVLRRAGLAPAGPIPSVWTREALVWISGTALVLLAAAAVVGTLSGPLSSLLTGRKIVVGPAFYNRVLIPVGLVLLAATGLAPLLRWGSPPSPAQKRAAALGAGAAGLVAVAAFLLGMRHPIALAVASLAALAVFATAGALVLDARRRTPERPLAGLLAALRAGRRRYAGLLVHLGFVCLALGVAGSALGTRRHEVVLKEGEVAEWAGRQVRLVRLATREQADKLVVEAQLEVAGRGGRTFGLAPARHFHLLEGEWTTEVAIESTWAGDFYAALQGGEEDRLARLELVENPMMRWIWLGGWVAGAGALVGLWPSGKRSAQRSPPPAPKGHQRSQARPGRQDRRLARAGRP